MPDSGLSLNLGELRSEICRYLQFGRSYETLPDREKADVDACVRRGMRQFLSPPPVGGDLHSHTWSWIRPEGTLTTTASTSTYDLPENFGGIVGDLSYQSSSDGAFRPIAVTSLSAFNARKQQETLSSGRPDTCAISPKSASSGEPDRPSRFQMHLFPTPDKAYTLKYQYVATVGEFTDRPPATQMPGGQMHGETIIASCLAVAENLTTDNPGRYMELFGQRLAASVSADRRLYMPSNLGPNTDNSDGTYRGRRTSTNVTYTG